MFDFKNRAGFTGPGPRTPGSFAVLRMEQPIPSQVRAFSFLESQAGVLAPAAVGIFDPAFGTGAPDHLRDGLQQDLVAPFADGQRGSLLFDLLQHPEPLDGIYYDRGKSACRYSALRQII